MMTETSGSPPELGADSIASAGIASSGIARLVCHLGLLGCSQVGRAPEAGHALRRAAWLLQGRANPFRLLAERSGEEPAQRGFRGVTIREGHRREAFSRSAGGVGGNDGDERRRVG